MTMHATMTARNDTTGTTVASCVKVADTHLSRAVGLLGRRGLDAGEALWIVPSRGVHTWFMRFAIDVAALDVDGLVVDVVHAMRPWKMRMPRKGAVGVLELPPGALQQTATKIGDRIVFENGNGSQD